MFQNPIAKAQRAGDAEALALAIGDLAPLYQATQNPELFDRLDFSKTADGVYSMRGVPALWQRNDREIKALREARQAQTEKENQVAQLEQLAGAAGKVTPAMKMMGGENANA